MHPNIKINNNKNTNNINNSDQTTPITTSLLYEGTTLTNNLRKHANAPKILSTYHPHPKYQHLKRIKLTMLDPELKSLEQKLNPRDKYGHDTNPEFFNDITLDDITCKCPHKIKYEKLFDKDDPTNEAMVWTACRHTTLAAAKRQMKGAPTPEPAVADDFVQHSLKIINNEIGEELKHFGYSVVDWYNHLNYKKQYALRHVLDYYNGDITNIPKKELKNIQNMHYTGILKEELQPQDGKPRMVCSIPQRTKYIMGPITWALEEIAAEKLNGYCGGKNLDEMAEHINHYLQQGFTKIIEGDGSAFDNTQDVSLKQLDREIYKIIAPSVYHVPKIDFLKVSQALYKTMDIEYIDGQKKKPLLRYKILGTVFSGDTDTTLMNTIRMAMYNRYVNDKAGLVFGKDYVCFAKGDDFTVMYKPYITDQQIHALYYKYFIRPNDDVSNPSTIQYGLGQILKFIEIGDASIIKFCSLNAWFVNPQEDKIYLTRDAKKFFSLSKYSRKTKAKALLYKIKYLDDIALSLETSYPQITYFTTIAQYHRKLAMALRKVNSITPKQYELYIKHQNTIANKQPQTQSLHKYHKTFKQLEEENSEYVKHRHIIYKIKEDYWSTMTQIEKTHTKLLTQQEADYVNKLMTITISTEYLKSMYDVGPKQKF